MKNATMLLCFLSANCLAEDSLLSAPVGVAGGQVVNAMVSAEISAGDESHGGRISSQDGKVVELGGYTGQLLDVVGFDISTSPPTVPDGGSSQLEAHMVMDDDTSVLFDQTEVTWSVVSGPLLGISTSGLVTAEVVAVDEEAVVQGDYQALSDQLTLIVEDGDPDNFRTYAGDGIDDDWQLEYFGIDHPDAGPNADPDEDGQNNYFEFMALVDPTNPSSFFWKSVRPSGADPDLSEVAFGPVSDERIYLVEASPDLTPGSYAPVPGMTSIDAGGYRTSLDPNPQVMSLFYRVQIFKP